MDAEITQHRAPLASSRAPDTPSGRAAVRPRPVRVPVRTVALCLCAVTAALLVAGLTVQWLRFGDGVSPKLARFLTLDGEGNLPALYAGLLLFVAATLAALIAASAPRDGWRWGVVAGLLFFMTADEVFSVHERLIEPVRGWFGGTLPGVLHHAWVLPYLVLVAAVALALWRFVFALEPYVRTPLLIAATVYVAGAIGMEMVGGWLVYSSGVTDSLAIHLVVVVEEGLEMFGVCLLIVALLRRLASWPGPLVLQVRD